MPQPVSTGNAARFRGVISAGAANLIATEVASCNAGGDAVGVATA